MVGFIRLDIVKSFDLINLRNVNIERRIYYAYPFANPIKDMSPGRLGPKEKLV